jgi:hypothetical protein
MLAIFHESVMEHMDDYDDDDDDDGGGGKRRRNSLFHHSQQRRHHFLPLLLFSAVCVWVKFMRRAHICTQQLLYENK